MARHEADREDLMREAVALRQRILLSSSKGQEIVIGFRADGSASIYVDQDPVWHFNRRGQLRRAFEAGQLIKAEAGRLHRMFRHREPNQVLLCSWPMSRDEQSAWVASVARTIRSLIEQWERGDLWVVQQIPAEEPVAQKALQLLRSLALGFSIAESPSVRGV